MRRTTVALVFTLACLPMVAHAQSIGDLAKKTAADREKRKTDPKAEPAKVFTDDDLKKMESSTPIATTPGAFSVPPATTPAPPPMPSADTPATAAVLGAAADVKKDEAYWRGRFTPLWAQLDSDEAQLVQASRRVIDCRAALDASQRAINGEVYVDRILKQKYLDAVDEESRLRGAVTADRRQLSDLEEDARRANVPPGWYRRR